MLSEVDRWRELVAADVTGEQLANAVQRLVDTMPDVDVVGQELKRVPKPWDEASKADLLRHKAFQVRWPEPRPESAGEEAFADWCVDRLEACGDVHRWLVDNLD